MFSTKSDFKNFLDFLKFSVKTNFFNKNKDIEKYVFKNFQEIFKNFCKKIKKSTVAKPQNNLIC